MTVENRDHVHLPVSHLREPRPFVERLGVMSKPGEKRDRIIFKLGQGSREYLMKLSSTFLSKYPDLPENMNLYTTREPDGTIKRATFNPKGTVLTFSEQNGDKLTTQSITDDHYEKWFTLQEIIASTIILHAVKKKEEAEAEKRRNSYPIIPEQISE